jgi:phage/plasmid-like protein (TIGR03299 family)
MNQAAMRAAATNGPRKPERGTEPMAHEIELDTKTGKSKMFAIEGTPVWHGLGQRVAKPPRTVQELMEVAGLGTQVETRPIFRKLDDGSYQEIPDRSCTTRIEDDRYLGVVGKEWTPVQNQTLAEIAFAMADQVEIHTAGSLRDGRHVWILSKFPETFHVAGEQHEAYICWSNGHDGTRSLTGTPTDITVVCKNTLAMADRSATQFRYAHTKGIGERIKAALATVRDIKNGFEQTYEGLARLGDARITTAQRNDYFNRVVDARHGSESRKHLFGQQLAERWDAGLGQEARGDTLLRAWNAVTDAVDHHVRPSYVNRASVKRTEKRFSDTIFGTGATIKRHALAIALDMASAGIN